VKSSGYLIQMLYGMNEFAKYPTTIYSNVVKVIVTFIIPFAFTGYYPSLYFLTGENPLFNIGGTVLISLVFFGISLLIWNKGIKAYESAGS
ncbi:MAG: ABC-2 family transporter protein, partial [Acutalibacteraceae bacterium]